jgi:hypothetical protein
MISSEVQRTLVKSPPELWAELSDPDALARHLGELGEIRIVRTEPERVVEWAAENTTGTVSIKASGWGTKVTISVTRELPVAVPTAAAETAATEELDAPATGELESATTAETAPGAEPGAEPGAAEPQAAGEPETAAEVNAVAEPSPVVVSEPESASEPDAVEPMPVVEPEPRRGFFARLFGRRRREAPSGPVDQAIFLASSEPPTVEELPPLAPDAPTAPDAFAAVRQVLEPQTFAAEHPFAAVPEVKQPGSEPTAPEPAPDADPQQTGDIAAELLAAEEAGAEEVTAVLTAVLDRLGAAHHRPFSRS